MKPTKPGERIKIVIDDNIERVAKEVLVVWGARAGVFQAGGRLFEIQVDTTNKLKFLINPPNAPRLLQIGSGRARTLAAKECSFGAEKLTKDGTTEIQKCMPPEWLGVSIVTQPAFEGVPVLSALVCAPTLRSDGQLIWERGYDESTGIYLESDLKVTVVDQPTQVDAKLALAKLFDVVADFDFVNEAARSVWVSGLLSIVARHSFAGPAPIFIIDASKRGSGKTMLADVASIIATGYKTSRMFYTDDDTEMDKRITSLALAGEQVVLIDNIVGKLDSPPLDAAVTSDSYRGRVLGKTEMTAAMPMKIVWWATGNGLIIGADTARRSLLSRLETSADHPEDRTGPRPGQVWKHPRLLTYVTENRVELLSAVLTIGKAYIQAGRPNMQLQPMGSFEAWSETVRSAIVWAGAADPCATVADAREADLQDYALRRMVQCWPVKNLVEVTSVMLLEWAEVEPPLSADPTTRTSYEGKMKIIRTMWRSALLEWLPARKGDLPTARELGYALRAIKGSVIGNFKIEALPHKKSGLPWQRIRISGSEADGDDGDDMSVDTNQASLSLVK